MNHLSNFTISVSIQDDKLKKINDFFEKHLPVIITVLLSAISVFSFIVYYKNGLGLAYNDARSHLDIGRRVVEGLKPGIAQLGSVWLPLPHALMIPTIWNDFMWHSGLSGGLISMISFVGTGLVIYLFLKTLGVSILGRVLGVLIFITNINILYLQSTAMTELLLIGTTTAGVWELVNWSKNNNLLTFVKAAFWVMLSTLIRYDGWFLFVFATALIIARSIKSRGYKTTEGLIILFCTLAGWGIFLWFLWNQLIFHDALYFAFGPYSAHAQQTQLEKAGNLITKGNLLFSLKVYLYAAMYNIGAFTLILGFLGSLSIWFDKKLKPAVRLMTAALIAPFIFNILALFLGHSVLFIQGLSGNTWFNVRYGIMMLPSVAIFIGYLIDRVKNLRVVIIGLLLFVTFFAFANHDAVTIDDAQVGSSQKNVSEVSNWLRENAKNKPGFVLISAASHDAIIFSSGLPMKKFIHEGTGAYWENATTSPDRWAHWIIARTNSDDDSTWRLVNSHNGFTYYNKVESYPFADIYELKDQYLPNLNTQPILPKQK